MMSRTAIGGPRRHVVLSAPQDEWLRKLSRQTGITESEHIRRALDAYRRLLEAYSSRGKR
jgi:hypothetical protein